MSQRNRNSAQPDSDSAVQPVAVHSSAEFMTGALRGQRTLNHAQFMEQ